MVYRKRINFIDINFDETNFLYTIRYAQGNIAYSKILLLNRNYKLILYQIDGISGNVLKEKKSKVLQLLIFIDINSLHNYN